MCINAKSVAKFFAGNVGKIEAKNVPIVVQRKDRKLAKFIGKLESEVKLCQYNLQ